MLDVETINWTLRYDLEASNGGHSDQLIFLTLSNGQIFLPTSLLYSHYFLFHIHFILGRRILQMMDNGLINLLNLPNFKLLNDIYVMPYIYKPYFFLSIFLSP